MPNARANNSVSFMPSSYHNVRFYPLGIAKNQELFLFEKYKVEFSAHVNHRGTIESMQELIESAGFRIEKKIESNTSLRYLNGTAFLNHSVIIIGFIDPWKTLFQEEDREKFFNKFEENLNKYSEKKGELKLTIPMVYFECNK